MLVTHCEKQWTAVTTAARPDTERVHPTRKVKMNDQMRHDHTVKTASLVLVDKLDEAREEIGRGTALLGIPWGTMAALVLKELQRRERRRRQQGYTMPSCAVDFMDDLRRQGIRVTPMPRRTIELTR
jgi:hypothetical protein